MFCCGLCAQEPTVCFRIFFPRFVWPIGIGRSGRLTFTLLNFQPHPAARKEEERTLFFFFLLDWEFEWSIALSLFFFFFFFSSRLLRCVPLIWCASSLFFDFGNGCADGMSLKVTGVYFSASSAGPGPGKMKATIRAARHHPPPPSSLAPQPIHYVHHQQQQQLPSAAGRNASNGNNMSGSPAGNDQQPPVKSNKSGNRIISNNHHYSNHHHSHLHSQSLDYLHLNFEEKRQIIASSLSLVDFLHHPPAKIKGIHMDQENRGGSKGGGWGWEE